MTRAERQELVAMWRERIADFRSSGMAVPAWAKAHQVSEYQVYYWVRKFRPMQEGLGSCRPRFVPVTVKEPEGEAAAALTVKVGAFAVEVRAGCDMEVLGRVVRTLALA